jgi:hypothetical protein
MLPSPRTPLLVIGLLFALSGLNSCEQESDAVDPWVPNADAVPVTDITDGSDAEKEQGDIAPGAWMEVPFEPAIADGEDIVDIWGYQRDGVNLLAFLTNAGHFGRFRDGALQSNELEIVPPTLEDATAFRGLFTSNGDTSWVVGHGGTVRTKGGLWKSPHQADEIKGDWNDVWSDGSQAMWFVGNDGAVLRSGYDGTNPERTTIGTEHWLAVTGTATHVYLISRKDFVRFAVNAAFPIDEGDPEVEVERSLASDIDETQVFKQICLLDPSKIFVVGSPTSLLMSDGEAPLTLAPLSTEPSGLNDVNGHPAGDLLTTGEERYLGLFDGTSLQTQGTENLPEGLALGRVWSFEDGSAYVTTPFDNRLFFRAAP